VQKAARQAGLSPWPAPSRPVSSHPFTTSGAFTVDKTELAKLQAYLRRKFELDTIKVVARPKKKDSAEVFIGDEFIAVIYRDDEDGEISWNLQMAILEMDLEED